MEKHLTKVRHAKQFFIKCFWISLIIMLVVWLFGTLVFNMLADLNFSIYGLEQDDYAIVFIMGMCLWKLLIIQFTLVPYIAARFLEKHIKNEKENCKKKAS